MLLAKLQAVVYIIVHISIANMNKNQHNVHIGRNI